MTKSVGKNGLSVPDKDTARLRYTQTEKAIADPTRNQQRNIHGKMKSERSSIDHKPPIWTNSKTI